MLATAISLAALAGVCLGLAADRFLLRDPAHRFAREFAALVTDTPIDWAQLHGPGPSPEPAGFAAKAVHAESLSDNARTLSRDDLDYYASSWQNVRGQFVRYPASALRLAQHLTANLLLNRGLLPKDTADPSALPESWTFPSARGYRQAAAIAAKAEADERGETATVTDADLGLALSLFEDFYWEIVTLAPVG
ncbi:MAG TPA: hypothetical protein VH372_10285 [Actinospica sp.]|nr:hypothetical protein [Actinospica sp.]